MSSTEIPYKQEHTRAPLRLQLATPVVDVREAEVVQMEPVEHVETETHLPSSPVTHTYQQARVAAGQQAGRGPQEIIPAPGISAAASGKVFILEGRRKELFGISGATGGQRDAG